MQEFNQFLQYKNSLLDNNNEDEEPGNFMCIRTHLSSYYYYLTGDLWFDDASLYCIDSFIDSSIINVYLHIVFAFYVQSYSLYNFYGGSLV